MGLGSEKHKDWCVDNLDWMQWDCFRQFIGDENSI